jgi:hypothetical protein
MAKTHNYGWGEVPMLPASGIGPRSDHASVNQEFAKLETFRARAAGLEQAAGGPVKIKMPSGAVLVTGGQNLITALTNGGQPVDSYPESPAPAKRSRDDGPRVFAL